MLARIAACHVDDRACRAATLVERQKPRQRDVKLPPGTAFGPDQASTFSKLTTGSPQRSPNVPSRIIGRTAFTASASAPWMSHSSAASVRLQVERDRDHEVVRLAQIAHGVAQHGT